jgi:acyl-CoA synthetase (AMP-forming)/AMP-acid ligase II
VPAFRLAGLLDHTVAAAPDRPAVVDGAGPLSYTDLAGRAAAVGAAVVASAVAPGERVAFVADAPVSYLTVLLGAAGVGVVSIPVNHRLAPAEVAGILADSGAALLVTTAAVLAGLAATPGALDGVRTAVVLDGAGVVVDPDGPARPGAVLTWAEWLDRGTVAEGRAPSPDPTVLQMYTSGTTGRPKGVLLSDANLATSIPEMCGLWRLDADARMLGVLPLFHIAGLGAALGTLWSGGTFVVAASPDAGALLDDIAEHRITNVVLASVLLQRMIEEAARRVADGTPVALGSLRVVGYGAAPISQQVLRDALRLLPCGLLQVYGLTESAGTITVLRPEDHDPGSPERLRSCGRALDSLELRLADPASGAPVPVGEVGEIWVRSPRVTAGYWGAPEATAEVITEEGYLRTGDLAYADEEGYVYLCDRLRDMIVTGGENVYPAEVEDVLGWHPGVAEAAVVGVPDDRWGETPRAIVVPRPGVDLDEGEILSFLRERLSHFKCPTSVAFAETLPRNATGKVLRRALREPYWAGRSRLVN